MCGLWILFKLCNQKLLIFLGFCCIVHHNDSWCFRNLVVQPQLQRAGGDCGSAVILQMRSTAVKSCTWTSFGRSVCNAWDLGFIFLRYLYLYTKQCSRLVGWLVLVNLSSGFSLLAQFQLFCFPVLVFTFCFHMPAVMACFPP